MIVETPLLFTLDKARQRELMSLDIGTAKAIQPDFMSALNLGVFTS